jgi:VCBS repeat
VTFSAQKAGGATFDFETIKLTNATIVSYDENGGGTARVALDYDKIEIDLTEQKSDGSLDTTHVFSWDRVTNQPGNDHAPVIEAIAPQVLHELANTTGSAVADAATLHATFTDADLSDTGFTAAVTAVVASGATAGLTLDNAALLALLTPQAVHKDAGVASGTADFAFSAPDKTFDYLAEGQNLTLTYTVSVDDHHGGTGSQTATVEIVGSNDAPVFTSPDAFTMPEDTTAVGQVAAPIRNTTASRSRSSAVPTSRSSRSMLTLARCASWLRRISRRRRTPMATMSTTSPSRQRTPSARRARRTSRSRSPTCSNPARPSKEPTMATCCAAVPATTSSMPATAAIMSMPAMATIRCWAGTAMTR